AAERRAAQRRRTPRRSAGAPPLASIRATVRRLIPNRHAISRCESPSAANALTRAHSKALRTSRPPRPSPTEPVEPASPAGQIRAATSGALFAARFRCSIGRRASTRDASGRAQGTYYGKGDKWKETTLPLSRYLASWRTRGYEFRHLNPREAKKPPTLGACSRASTAFTSRCTSLLGPDSEA